MLRRTALFLSFSLVTLPAFGAVQNELGVIPSVALVGDATSLLLNPGGLGASPPSLLISRQGWSTGSTGLFMNTGSFGLGYINRPLGSFYVMGLGLGDEAFRYGMNYHFPAEGSPGSVDLGILSRPNPTLSLGFTVRNLLNSPPEYQFGAGIRPFGPRLTLSLDLPYSDGIPFRPFGGVDAEVLDGIHLRGQVSSDAFLLGFGLNAGQIGLSGLGNLDRASANISMSSAHKPSVLEARGGSVAILDLEEKTDPGEPSSFAQTEAISNAQADPRVSALVLKIGEAPGGWAHIEEVRDAVLRFRRSGKKAWAYLEETDFRGYYLASAADHIAFNPMGRLEFNGIAVTYLYFKGLLDNLGIRPQFYATGPYKSFHEPFDRKSPSPAERAQTQAYLDNQFERIVRTVSVERKLPPATVRALIEGGVYQAPSALAAHLVDGLAERDEVKQQLEKTLGHPLAGMNAGDLGDAPRSWAPGRIAVVQASGGIVSGESGFNLLMGPTIGADTLIRALRDVREDQAIKSVVFRINSPGGSAIASELIRHELVNLAAKKPLVISFGDVAGSGGYWLAMVPGSRIFAEPGTLTGSIGVVTGKLNIDGLFKKIGISATTLKDGSHADMNSPLRNFDKTEERILRDEAELFYQKFVEIVAAARNLPQVKVRELAGGRIYSGEAALGVGLVDQIGGLQEAIAEATKKAELENREIQLAFYPQLSPFGTLVNRPAKNELGAMLESSAEWPEKVLPWLKPRILPFIPSTP